MKLYRYASLFFVLLISASCKRIGRTGSDEARTLQSIKVALISIKTLDRSNFNLDVYSIRGQIISLRNLITMPQGSPYLDAWGEGLLCSSDESYIYVWSSGYDKIDDNMQGDDLALKMRLDLIEAWHPSAINLKYDFEIPSHDERAAINRGAVMTEGRTNSPAPDDKNPLGSEE